MSFKPKCLNNEAPVAYSAEGYLIPCCWVDRNGCDGYERFYKQSLHIDNNESVEDILLSDTWLEFYNMLKDYPHNAPKHCHRKCTSGTKFFGTSRDVI